MSNQNQNAWELSLGQNSELLLCAVADTSDSYRVQRGDSTKSPLLTLRNLLRLAVEVIRNKETARQFSYMAIRQLRLRSSKAQKRSIKARVEKIGEYYGGALAIELRSVFAECKDIQIDGESFVEHVEGDLWRIRTPTDEHAPILSWHALVTLAVKILRDPLLEELFPTLYVPYLRTPDEALLNSEDDNEVASESTAEAEPCSCGRDSSAEERIELEAFLEELILREERLQQSEILHQEAQSALKAREANLHRLEEHLFTLRARIQSELPQQEEREPRRRNRKRSRHRR